VWLGLGVGQWFHVSGESVEAVSVNERKHNASVKPLKHDSATPDSRSSGDAKRTLAFVDTC